MNLILCIMFQTKINSGGKMINLPDETQYIAKHIEAKQIQTN